MRARLRRLAVLLLLPALPGRVEAAPPAGSEPDPYAGMRAQMVRQQIEARGVKDPAVLAALRMVPRHRFVPPALAAEAYADEPLPIGEGQTISQPYIVALMTELLQVAPGERVLEIGTGSGYQAAVLAELGAEVYSIEIVEGLGRQAAARLAALGYERVHLRIGDGYRGWPERAPFAGILVTAAPDHIPRPLLEQLAPGGRLVIPVGEGIQQLEVHRRRPQDGPEGPIYERETVLPVRFVPMTGEVQSKRPARK
jgi:protein-L-isoaspartate(D-aspartate) O-methyltransferase